MEQSVNKSAGLFMLGLLAGAAIVALTTPKRGDEVRYKLKDAVKKAQGKMQEKAEDTQEELQEAMETTRDRFGSTKLLDERGHLF